mgnify:CR=1 FL=1
MAARTPVPTPPSNAWRITARHAPGTPEMRALTRQYVRDMLTAMQEIRKSADNARLPIIAITAKAMSVLPALAIQDGKLDVAELTLARARADEARLETAAVQRRAVGQAIVGAVGLMPTLAAVRAGTVAYYVPSSVIKGMLAGIGVIEARRAYGATRRTLADIPARDAAFEPARCRDRLSLRLHSVHGRLRHARGFSLPHRVKIRPGESRLAAPIEPRPSDPRGPGVSRARCPTTARSA